MAFSWARWFYTAALWLLQPVYFLRFYWRSVAEPAYRLHLGQRWGLYLAQSRSEAAGQRLWVHAVSLGETRAAAPLIEALRQHYPGLSILLTHSTATGWQAGTELLKPGDEQAWLPIDTPAAVSRFLSYFSPALGVLLETEIWPNLLFQAQRRAIPMVLANARLSARSLQKGLRLAPLMKPAVQSLTLILAQSEADAQRLLQAGACAQRMKVCGNLKFDMTPNPAQLLRGRVVRRALKRPVVLAASTREGEELPLLQAWQQQMQLASPEDQAPLLVLVPRHPQRFDDVVRQVQALGLTHVRRSQLNDADLHALSDRLTVCVGDTIGELPFYYALADVALLGGSFEPLGGQNLIEAAACGCTLVMGPHTFNFTQAAELALAAGAAYRVDGWVQGVSVACSLAQSNKTVELEQRALAFAEQHRGAAKRMAENIFGRPIVPINPALQCTRAD